MIFQMYLKYKTYDSSMLNYVIGVYLQYIGVCLWYLTKCEVTQSQIPHHTHKLDVEQC